MDLIYELITQLKIESSDSLYLDNFIKVSLANLDA